MRVIRSRHLDLVPSDSTEPFRRDELLQSSFTSSPPSTQVIINLETILKVGVLWSSSISSVSNLRFLAFFTTDLRHCECLQYSTNLPSVTSFFTAPLNCHAVALPWVEERWRCTQATASDQAVQVLKKILATEPGSCLLLEASPADARTRLTS
ncbi:hypothetical protein BT63DRAFT_451907 [Microthyrium microscopicum]|uniref:Uncharacterized protein n=1 Tax=Microthyrium microscopicum TaxID=703497 RepID=A0A6A6UNN6_9PEZI|nr:hypothetical protein BT63DRAFT_451907 [Microthyrium microscopicum]